MSIFGAAAHSNPELKAQHRSSLLLDGAMTKFRSFQPKDMLGDDSSDDESGFSSSEEGTSPAIQPSIVEAEKSKGVIRSRTSLANALGSLGTGHGVNVDAALRRAITSPPSLRTAEEVLQIVVAVRCMREEFFGNLNDDVLWRVCERLTLEEYHESQVIFNYADEGDKIYLTLTGGVLIEIPRPGQLHLVMAGATSDRLLVPVAHLGPGKVFGELAIIGNCHRAGKATASKRSQLLALTKEDYEECIGNAQKDFVDERVTFLRSADRSVLEGTSDTDLSAMANYLRLETYGGENVVAEQGADADRIIFVKSGFCKVLRQLHPRYHGHLKSVAGKCLPPVNPFTVPKSARSSSDAEEALAANRIHASLGGPTALRKLLQQHHAEDIGTGFSPPTPSAPSSARAPKKKKLGLSSQSAAEMAINEGVVSAGTLQAGQSFGVRELFEGIPYQCTLVADPCVSVYTISKYDLIRCTSRSILHKLFVDYSETPSDDRIIAHMKQQSRWNSFKADLLDEIRSKRHPVAALDRRSAARRAGGSHLSSEDYERIWSSDGDAHSHLQASKGARQSRHGNIQTERIFHLHCVRNKEGRAQDVIVEEEVRDAAMQALRASILGTVAQSKARKKALATSGDGESRLSLSPPQPSGRVRQKQHTPRYVNKTEKLESFLS
mmetsp:Transcript_72450/g.172692  ORF Transcript_72450/g.172692 Transcript_72450/m.172692 type:complete len:665 (+) Transcript_72450:98-2092(+)